MKRLGIVACACLVLAGGGCYPERIVWSPDGEHALVAAKEHLYLCDPNGKLSDLGTNVPACMAWLADSKRYVAAMQDKLTAWKDVEPLLSAEDKDRLIRLAEEMREEILKSEKVELGKLKCVQGKDSGDLSAAKMYLRERRAEGLAAKLGPAWKEFESASRDCTVIGVCESTGATSQPARVIARSLNNVVSIRVPAHGKAVAWSAARPRQQGVGPADLLAVPTDGKAEPRPVAAECSWYFDWSADGQQLVYGAVVGAAEAGDEPRLGDIQQRKVCTANGTLLKEFEGPRILAGGLFGQMARVRCLRDGRILFSSVELELPIAPDDMAKKGNLFMADPGRQATITRLLTRAAQADAPDGLDYFSVSPDGTRVCIPGGDGEVAVVELASGKLETIVDKPKEGAQERKLHTVPVWRAGGELCLMVPPGHPLGSPGRAEIILWSAPGKARLLSKDWPDEVIKGLSE